MNNANEYLFQTIIYTFNHIDLLYFHGTDQGHDYSANGFHVDRKHAADLDSHSLRRDGLATEVITSPMFTGEP